MAQKQTATPDVTWDDDLTPKGSGLIDVNKAIEPYQKAPVPATVDVSKAAAGDITWDDPTPPAQPKNVIQTHKGGPLLDLDQLPDETRGMDPRDVNAIRDYPTWKAYHQTISQNIEDAKPWLINQAIPNALGIGAGMLLGPEAEPATAMTTRGMAGWVMRQAGWDALTAGGVGAGAEAVRHGVAREVIPEKEAPRSWGDLVLDPLKTGGLSAAGGFLTGGLLNTVKAKNILSSLPTVAKANDLIFNALGSNNPGFRENVMWGIDDLARMAKADKKAGTGIFAPGAAGGMLEPDMRSRALLDTLDKYMDEKYKTQVGQQMAIANRMGATVDLPIHPGDLDIALDTLDKGGLPSSPASGVLGRLRQNPGQPISAEDANVLREQVNAFLRSYETKGASEQAKDFVTKKGLAALVNLDAAIKDGSNSMFQRIGLPGFEQYEREYAALADLRNNLAKGMNAAERDRLKISAIPVVRPTGAGVKFTPYNFMSRQGRDLQRAMKMLADDPHLGTQPLWHANAGGLGPTGAWPQRGIAYGALPPAPGPITPHGQQGMPATTPWGEPTPQRPPGPIPAGPVPPGPPGPPATGTHFPPGGPVPPWSSYARPQGPMEPSNISQTGIQEPLPASPSVPAHDMPAISEPGRRTGPRPHPATQLELAPTFPAMPKSEPVPQAYKDAEDRWYHASEQLDKIDEQLKGKSLTPDAKKHLTDLRSVWESEMKAAETSAGNITGTGLEAPTKGAPQARVIPDHIRTALREAGLGESNYLGTKSGMVHIRTGYETKPMTEGGKPGPVDIAFKEGEPITAQAIRAKMAARRHEFGSAIINQ